ncbi:MAG: aminotransferase class [Parcubacteria group bacterium]|nr:aminotransferase class [Parcubacteria group bacterium]
MGLFHKKRVFLDYAAGKNNPSAIYKEGVEAKKRLEEARLRAARLMQVQARDVVFTSGGTEADNLALLGIVQDVPNAHIVTTSIEHPAILKCAEEIKRRGGEVTVVEAVDGVVQVEDVMSALKENTILVSVMYVNNKTGAIQPISKIARRINEWRKKNNSTYPYFHSDASQAIGMLPIQFSSLGVDLLTFGGSKISLTKGAGVLAFRPHVKISPVLFGGGQERGIRPGTENVETILELVSALESAEFGRTNEFERLQQIQSAFIKEAEKIPGITINTPEHSSPHIVSVSFEGKLHEFLAIQLDHEGVSVSTGSSCKFRGDGTEIEALRFSFGQETTISDVKFAARILQKIMLE